MEVTYINANGERLTLRQARPFFLTRAEGLGRTRQTISTFKAPEQDGVFFIASTLDMRNITLEGTLVARNLEDAYSQRARFLRVLLPKNQGMLRSAFSIGHSILRCSHDVAGLWLARQRKPWLSNSHIT